MDEQARERQNKVLVKASAATKAVEAEVPTTTTTPLAPSTSTTVGVSGGEKEKGGRKEKQHEIPAGEEAVVEFESDQDLGP